MSKSLARVIAALKAAGSPAMPIEMAADTRTARQAADAAGCHVDQIAKSIILQGTTSGAAILFLTPGGRQVDNDLACGLAAQGLARADAALVRSQTGFAIGGVSPIGLLHPIQCFFDPYLLTFETIWAAAGTPRHIFSINPNLLLEISGATLGPFSVAENVNTLAIST